MTVLGDLILVEVNAAIGGYGWWFKRSQDRREVQHAENQARLTAQDEALTEQSRALGLTVDRVQRLDKQLDITMERVTGIRESTAMLRASVDMLLAMTRPPRALGPELAHAPTREGGG